MAHYAECSGCGSTLPAWHVYQDGTCINCTPDTCERFAELEANNGARDDIRGRRWL